MPNLSHLRREIPKAEYYSITTANPSALETPEYGLWPYWNYYYFVPDEVANDLEDMTWVEEGGGPWSYRYDCPVAKHHETHGWYDGPVGALVHGSRPEVPPFVWTMDPVPLINADLANRLRSSNLRGLEIRPVEIDRVNSGRKFHDELYFIAGPIPLPTVPRRIDPKVKNCCPFCGLEPYFCQTCGYCRVKCPKCEKQAIQWDRDEDDPDHLLRFDVKKIFPEHLNQAAGAIDLARCEKVDFSGNSVYSRRALEFLMDAQAYPLEITPLKVLFEDGKCGYTLEDAVPVLNIRDESELD